MISLIGMSPLAGTRGLLTPRCGLSLHFICDRRALGEQLSSLHLPLAAVVSCLPAGRFKQRNYLLSLSLIRTKKGGETPRQLFYGNLKKPRDRYSFHKLCKLCAEV